MKEKIKIPRLSEWNWCLDYSESVGQADSILSPLVFQTKIDAMNYNGAHYPTGKIIKVKIIRHPQQK